MGGTNTFQKGRGQPSEQPWTVRQKTSVPNGEIE